MVGIRCYEASSLMFGRSLVVDSVAAVKVAVEMGAVMGEGTAVATAAAMAEGNNRPGKRPQTAWPCP